MSGLSDGIECPRCGSREASLRSPDYGDGAECYCYRCDRMGYRFRSCSPEALAASAASHALSRSNAWSRIAAEVADALPVDPGYEAKLDAALAKNGGSE